MALLIPQHSGVPVLLATRTAPAARTWSLNYTSQQLWVGMLLGEPELEFKSATSLNHHSFFSATNRHTHSRAGSLALGPPREIPAQIRLSWLFPAPPPTFFYLLIFKLSQQPIKPTTNKQELSTGLYRLGPSDCQAQF